METRQATREQAHQSLLEGITTLIGEDQGYFATFLKLLKEGLQDSQKYESAARTLCNSTQPKVAPKVLPIVRLMKEKSGVLNISFTRKNASSGLSVIDYAKKNYSAVYDELIEEKSSLQGELELHPSSPAEIARKIKKRELELNLAYESASPNYPRIFGNHINLSFAYLASGSTGEEGARAHIEEAVQLERSGKLSEVFIKAHGVSSIIANFLSDFINKDMRAHYGYHLVPATKLFEFSPKEKKAVEAVETFLDRLAKHPEAHLKIFAMEAAFDFIGAMESLKDKISPLMPLVLKMPAKDRSLHNKVQCLYKIKQYTKVVELAEALLTLNAGDTEAQYYLGDAWGYLREYKKAAEPLMALLKMKNPPEGYVSFCCAKLALAAAHLVCLQDFEGALSCTRAILKHQHQNADVLLTQANAYFGLKELYKAGEALKKVKADDEETREKLAANRLRLELMELSVLAYEKKDFFQAQKKGENLLQRYGNLMDVRIALTEVYCGLRDYGKSLQHLIASKIDQGSIVFLRKAVQLHTMLENHLEAEKLARRILVHKEANPEHRIAAYTGITRRFIAEGLFKENIEECWQFLKDFAQSNEEKRHLFISMADLAFKKENNSPEEVLFYGNLAIQLGSREVHPMLYQPMGFAHLMVGSLSESIKYLSKAIELGAKNLNNLIALGQAYYLAGPENLEKVLLCFSQALDLDPSCFTLLSSILPQDILERLEINQQSEALNNNIAQLKAPAPIVPEALPEQELPLKPPIFPKAKPAQTHEQIIHSIHQAEKKRQAQMLKSETKQPEEKAVKGWLLPALGFLNVNDERLGKVHYRSVCKADSNLYAFLNTTALSKVCNEDLLKRWQGLVKEGKVVDRYQKPGIRLLTTKESQKVESEIGPGYVAKLKLLGVFGNPRAYGKLLPSEQDSQKQVYVFDRVIWKH